MYKRDESINMDAFVDFIIDKVSVPVLHTFQSFHGWSDFLKN